MTDIATATASANEPASWDRRPGEVLLAGYLATALLGDGVRCETWLCWSERHLAFVAVKLPRPTEVASSGARAALRREASALAAAHHPALPHLLDAQPDALVPHLVTELIEGPTLAALVDDEGPLEPDEVVLIGIQLAVALHHLHTVAGLVHLDVTPGNIVLRDGRPVLLDLGIASPVGSASPSRPGPRHARLPVAGAAPPAAGHPGHGRVRPRCHARRAAPRDTAPEATAPQPPWRTAPDRPAGVTGRDARPPPPRRSDVSTGVGLGGRPPARRPPAGRGRRSPGARLRLVARRRPRGRGRPARRAPGPRRPLRRAVRHPATAHR